MLYIETAQLLRDNIHLISNAKVLGLDTETTALDPYKGKIRLIQLSDGTNTLVIDVFKVGKQAVSEVLKPILENKDIVKVLHNSKFDIKFIKYHLNIDVERIFDSMLASIMLEGGILPKDEKNKIIKGFHGLGQVSERYLGVEVDKDEQKSDWSGTLSENQIKYAGNDAEVMPPLRLVLIEKLKEANLLRCAKLEFEAVLPTAWLELNGIYLDFDEWTKVAEDNLNESYKYAELVYQELKDVIPQGALFGEPSINLDSPAQVQKYFRDYGIPMPDSTKEEFLTPLKDYYPIIKNFIEYKGKVKAHSSFGENYRKFLNPVTGRIHADFKQIGAETGRYAPSSPNLAQIPKDKEHRNCFKAEEGNIYVISDYGQQELRLLADFSQDKNLLQVFNSGKDLHIATAAHIFKKDIEQVTHEDRDMAKRMNYLLTYGGGANRFSRTANVPQWQAQEIIDDYFKAFKGVKRWLNYQKNQVLNTRESRSMFNRLTKYKFDINNGRERSGVQRNAANMPLQSSAADILKIALRIFYDLSKNYQKDIRLVNIIHDEIIVETKKELLDEATDFLVTAMQKAWTDNIKSVGITTDVKVLPHWEKG